MSAAAPSPSASPSPPSTTASPPPAVSKSPPPPPTTAAPPPSSPSPPTASPPSSSPPPPASAPPPSNPVIPSPPSNSSSSAPPPPPPTPSSNSPPSGSSPPPPPRSPARSSPPPPPPSSGSSSNVSVPIIAAASAAAAVAVVLVLYCVYRCCCKKKRKSAPYVLEQPNYGDHPPKDSHYGGRPPGPQQWQQNAPQGPQQWQHNAPQGPQQWQHNAPPPVDHFVKISPSPTPHFVGPPRSSSGADLPPPPPPPPPPFSSGETSSSGLSGKQLLPPPSPPLNLGHSKTMFSYEELEVATKGFSQSNLLGQGGFGSVYKGIFPGGQTVAVKQLKVGGSQGEREFQAEVEIISRVHHRHLVSLVGYCIAGNQRLLVYEFVANDTLEHHLHGKGQPTMDWPTRMKIALGSARGLAYLHEDCYPKIIHRDIKSSNILLDSNFEAKVADFGLAKLASDNFTHVSTRVMGTFGYLAPEYASSGKLTDRSDVFSYGVVLLELITGRRPVDSTPSFSEDSLVDWARPLLSRAIEDGNIDDLVDPRLRNYDTNEMMRVVTCAASCVRHSARRRPRMGQIVRALEGDVSLNDLNEGVKPGQSSAFSAFASSDYDSSQYSEDMKKFRKMALNSQDFGSEYSNPTSEYGLNPSVSSGEDPQSKEKDFSTGKSRASKPTSHRRNYSSGISEEHGAGKGKYPSEDF